MRQWRVFRLDARSEPARYLGTFDAPSATEAVRAARTSDAASGTYEVFARNDAWVIKVAENGQTVVDSRATPGGAAFFSGP